MLFKSRKDFDKYEKHVSPNIGEGLAICYEFNKKMTEITKFPFDRTNPLPVFKMAPGDGFKMVADIGLNFVVNGVQPGPEFTQTIKSCILDACVIAASNDTKILQRDDVLFMYELPGAKLYVFGVFMEGQLIYGVSAKLQTNELNNKYYSFCCDTMRLFTEALNSYSAKTKE